MPWKIRPNLEKADPAKTFAQRKPEFVARYKDDQDPFDYSIDTFARSEPFFKFFYEEYFRVQMEGIENIPDEGAAIIVGNHSGVIPVDGAMMAIALLNKPVPRRIRYLVTDWFFTLPGVKDWIAQTGQVRASRQNARILLDRGELVGIYPEGVKGIGKPFRERYRLMDFNPGFVKLALEKQCPIVIVSTLGGDEIYPELYNMKPLARLLKMPFFPITPAFPWLPFPLFMTPMPVAWRVIVHEPLYLPYGPEIAKDSKLVLQIARDVQYTIQRDLNRMLRERKSLF